jgi:hypothetical protein
VPAGEHCVLTGSQAVPERPRARHTSEDPRALHIVSCGYAYGGCHCARRKMQARRAARDSWRDQISRGNLINRHVRLPLPRCGGSDVQAVAIGTILGGSHAEARFELSAQVGVTAEPALHRNLANAGARPAQKIDHLLDTQTPCKFAR